MKVGKGGSETRTQGHRPRSFTALIPGHSRRPPFPLLSWPYHVHCRFFFHHLLLLLTSIELEKVDFFLPARTRPKSAVSLSLLPMTGPSRSARHIRSE